MQSGFSIELTQQLQEIVSLCTEIERAVRDADWDLAGTLLSRRHHLLEKAFVVEPTTAGEARELHDVAERVMAFDKDLIPLAETARGEAAGELKKLRRGRQAASAYQQNSR